MRTPAPLPREPLADTATPRSRPIVHQVSEGSEGATRLSALRCRAPAGRVEPEVMLASVSHRLRDPVSWSNASQLAKTVLAAMVAWVLAVDVLHLSQAFMAPWAALLTV